MISSSHLLTLFFLLTVIQLSSATADKAALGEVNTTSSGADDQSRRIFPPPKELLEIMLLFDTLDESDIDMIFDNVESQNIDEVESRNKDGQESQKK